MKDYKKAYEALNEYYNFVDERRIKVSDEIMKGLKRDLEVLAENVRKIEAREGKRVPYSSENKMSKKAKTLRGKPYQRLKVVSPGEQREKMDKLWQEMERKKMDIEEGSKWYLISSDWFNQWKEWTGFSTVAKISDEETTSDCLEKGNTRSKSKSVDEPGRIDNAELIEVEEIMLFGEINLKDNLREEEDYIIVNSRIWKYLYEIYDGIPILREAIKNFDKAVDYEEAEVIIEVNLVKLYLFEVPRENKQDFYEVVLASRN